MSDLADRIRHARFTPVRLREGYAMGEVDSFLDELVAAAETGRPLGPLVDAARFSPVRMVQGYDMGEVDEFLASLTSAPAGTTPPVADPATPSRPPEVSALPGGVVQEQKGLLSRLFGRG